jgi:hypothetical protein
MQPVGKVFISHTSIDKAFVDRLVADLKMHSIPVWYDKIDLSVGESVPGKINEGIADAKYFVIVLSPDAVNSAWVREELNAALMKQVSFGGTFLVPVLFRDCEIPPLLAHRKYADFRSDYGSALKELLSVWGKDSEACAAVNKNTVYPWRDLNIDDSEFVYLHSTRFDKVFRMSCSLSWTISRTIDYITGVLSLPWNIERAEVGMKWSFSYSIRIDGRALSLSDTLTKAGVTVGTVLQLGISGTYEDMYEKELKEMWDGSKVYLMTMELMTRREWLTEQVAARRNMSRDDLKKIADSCFSHV